MPEHHKLHDWIAVNQNHFRLRQVSPCGAGNGNAYKQFARFIPSEGARWTAANLYEIIENNPAFKNVILSLPAEIVLTASRF